MAEPGRRSGIVRAPVETRDSRPPRTCGKLVVWQAREPLLDDGAVSGPRNLLPILVTRWAFHSPRDLGPHLFDFPQRLQELG